MSRPSKLTVEFNAGMTDILEEMAETNGTSKVDVIRRALALYFYVWEEVKQKDKTFKLSVVTKENDKVVRDIILT